MAKTNKIATRNYDFTVMFEEKWTNISGQKLNVFFIKKGREGK